MKPARIFPYLFLFLAVTALFLPALAGWLGIFHDDVAMDVFPWQYYLARHMRNGVIPLWDPETWCGAKPFYARFYADTYYPPLWPFLLLARLDDLNQSFLMISLLPLILHYLLAAIGMYVLTRFGLRLRPFPAFIAAWVYLFSPAFSYSYVWPPVVNVQAWTPWFLYTVILMDRRIGWGRVAAAGVIFALMLLAAQPPHVGYGLLLAGLLALGLGLRRLKGANKLRFFRSPLQLSAAVLLGLALSAVFWLSALDGYTHTELHLEQTYEAMTGADGSMSPIYLTTLFIPDLFGTVSNRNNTNWVEAVTDGVRFWDANMSGGMILMFLVLAGAFLVVGRPRLRRLRFWAVLAVFLWILSVLLMLGRHTPFYRIFYETVPLLSSFPFPIRYRFLQAIAASWLAGLGMEYLISGERAGRGWPPRLVWGYLALAGLAVVLALVGLPGLAALRSGHLIVPGLKEIMERGNLFWFITNPILYFLAAGYCLVLAWRGLRGRLRAAVVAGLVMMETALLSIAVLYFCIFRFHEPRPQQIRSLNPSVHPMIQQVLGPLPLLRSDPSLRWATDQPFYDNFARFDLSGSYAFMGYDMKPLEKRFKRAFEAAYRQPVDWPIYWNFLRPVFPAFLSNMSVGYLMDSRPDNVFAGGKTVKMGAQPDFYLHWNPRTLPRAFVLDRVVSCSEAEAMEELVKGDLRKGVFVVDGEQLAVSGKQFPEGIAQDSGTAHRLPLTAYQSFDPGSEDEYIAHFNELQSANPTTELDFSNPNRVKVEVSITHPAMLVLTEVWYPGWRARVDGKPAQLYRVNYLQRGVWLERGRHRVELNFSPRAWRIGVVVSLVSWGGMILLLFLKFLRGKNVRLLKFRGGR